MFEMAYDYVKFNTGFRVIGSNFGLFYVWRTYTADLK